MLETLAKYGFKSAGSCNCNGIYTLKYKNGPYMVRIRKNRYTFAIQENGSYITSFTKLTELEKKLKELDESIQGNKKIVQTKAKV